MIPQTPTTQTQTNGKPRASGDDPAGKYLARFGRK